MLYLGDPRVIPFPSEDLGDGVAMAIVDDARTDSRDAGRSPTGPPTRHLRDVVRADRRRAAPAAAGRLLAPFGIRFVVVPVIDGAASTASTPLPVPGGLVDALGAQLDLVRVAHAAELHPLREPRAPCPSSAQLSGPLAEASTATIGRRPGRRRHLRRAPVFPTSTQTREAAGDVAAGVVDLATPRASEWELTVGGAGVPSRDAFGVATAFDVGDGGPGHAALRPAVVPHDLARHGRRAVARHPRRRQSPLDPEPPADPAIGEEALIDLDAEPGAALPDERTGFAGWVDDLFDGDDDGAAGRSTSAAGRMPEEPP